MSLFERWTTALDQLRAQGRFRQFSLPAGIDFHYFWGCTLAALVVFGPGSISIDAWVLRRLGIDRR